MVVATSARAALLRRPSRHWSRALKILVLGRTGQLARSLAERAAPFPELEMRFVARPEFDLRDEARIRTTIGHSGAEAIVNAAAYTAVDQAESDLQGARLANAIAPGAIAAAAREVGAKLVHISTDYVFDGHKPEPYVETDPVSPINAYGRTKLEGEEAVRSALPEHVIVRTSWVYSFFGRNFVKTMLRLAQGRDILRVVDDQVGTPTSAQDLADALLTVVRGWSSEGERGLGETFHFAGDGRTSWAGFARHVLEVSRRRGGPWAAVDPIRTEDYPTPAVRPRYSILDSSKFADTFGYSPSPWRCSAAEVTERLVDSGEIEQG